MGNFLQFLRKNNVFSSEVFKAHIKKTVYNGPDNFEEKMRFQAID